MVTIVSGWLGLARITCVDSIGAVMVGVRKRVLDSRQEPLCYSLRLTIVGE